MGHVAIGGETFYLTRWDGYKKSESTLEPEGNVSGLMTEYIANVVGSCVYVLTAASTC